MAKYETSESYGEYPIHPDSERHRRFAQQLRNDGNLLRGPDHPHTTWRTKLQTMLAIYLAPIWRMFL